MKPIIHTKTKYLLSCLAILILSASATFAQTTLAKWTFETSGLGSSTPSFIPGANTATTNFYAEAGTQAGTAVVIGRHVGSATYTSPAGNGSAKSLSANTWTNVGGDYWQCVISTVGYEGIVVSYDQTGSATGPRDFSLQYSTDGVNFTTFSNYTAVQATWTAGGAVSTTSQFFNLSAITSLNNVASVYIRIVVASSTSLNAGTVAAGGTGRIDNLTVTGNVPGAAIITVQPANTNYYVGDTAVLSVTANGSAPLYYQWYYFTNGATSTNAVVDGSSGYGTGTISGSTNASLVQTLAVTNQSGKYFVIVSNSINSVTSSVVQLNITNRFVIVTNIAYLHTLHNANYVWTDSTNLYQVEGVVTTSGDLVSSGGQSCFIQDASGGINFFFFTDPNYTLPSLGDYVRVVAPLDQFQGTLEMHLVPNNPAHTMQVFSNANTLPTPRYFNFTTIDPNAMEGYTNISGIVSAYEGAYVVISNVFLGITNASPTLVVDETIFATNLTGQVFTLRVPNNALTQPFGGTLSGNFAKSIKGALAQFQGSGTVLTNNYSIYLDLLSNIEYGTPPAPQSPPPTISSTVNSGGNLVFSGTNNNTSGGQTYFVLTSTNVGLSLSNWTVLSTNTFNADGTFSVTNPVGTGGQQFFLLQVP